MRRLALAFSLLAVSAGALHGQATRPLSQQTPTGRDPFIPSADPNATSESTEPAPDINAEIGAVMFAGKHKLATVRIARELSVIEEGQKIGRWLVKSITPTEVVWSTTYQGHEMDVVTPVKSNRPGGTPSDAPLAKKPALPAGIRSADLPLLPPPMPPVNEPSRPERP